MFLRSISIRGFKSFADKTALEFAPGASVIVGPNGSGKSNLVDAISWVLGEQGARTLRSDQMADVIFAGTPARPALGMAEVKLVIDNSAGRIPVPMTEIEVGRTIFRSGESEYRIGGQVVRLLDVQELLAETGIGRALHTVVGQGQLEEILTAKPEERRRYIEEAAGVAKHRKRKERAQRKLDGLEHDLLRLQDVVTELKRQLKPLRQQAEMATKHESLTDEADALSAKLAAARLRALLDEQERRSEGWDRGLEERTGARDRLEALDTEVLAAADARAGTSRTLAEAEMGSRQAQASRAEAEQAYRGAVERETAARRELGAQATRTARLDAVGEDITRIEGELARATEELTAAEADLRTAEEAFAEADQQRRDIEETRRRMGEEAAGRRAEVEALERSLATGERERERVEATLSEVAENLATADAERTELEGTIEELDGTTAPLDERRTELETERHRLVTKLEELEDIRRRHEARKNLLDARRRDIEETPGSRFLQEHEGRALGLLKDLVKVESGLERALVAALGPLADAVVYAETDDALEDAPEGDGAILAISLGGPVPLGLKDERRLLAAVEADPAARGIVSTILRNVYLAESLAAASAKQTAHPNASFVTADGVLVGPAVIHTAREADARAREIRAELQVVAHDLAATVQAMKPKRERLDEVAAEVASLQERIDEADAAITAAAERLARGESDRSAMRKEEELLRQRSAALAEAAETARDRLEALGPLTVGEAPELPPIPQPPVRQRVAVETLRQTRGSHEARLSQLRSEQENLRAHDPSQLRADLTLAEEAKEAAELAVRTAEEIVTQAEEVRTAAAEAERAAAEREAEVNKAWRDASTALDELRERYEDQDRLRDDIERRIREAERLLREGHDADPTEILATLADDDTIETLERRSELVQRRLGLLGRVNLLATGELEQVQERYDFLQRELDDVHAARRDLHEVIARVDREITETFVGAFEDVSREYQRLIAELFPGGEGRLILTDPTDPLTAGIEIEANPGRKRVKRISLLSGGERSLAAMAFLFAIFTARPSPFYLMDEVEPALDDVNLHRFLRLVDGFAKTSQVIIVTHQKRTMEIAGMMYGVSLGADGTTKVVAQRLEQDVDLGRDSRLEGSAAGEPPVDATVG